LAATLKEKLQLETQLVAGGRGAFEVFAEDRLLFSKLNEGRFPEEQEMVDLLS
jgi:selT/selW/selH-like putative selenoprotein